jgi:hypothetical protein
MRFQDTVRLLSLSSLHFCYFLGILLTSLLWHLFAGMEGFGGDANDDWIVEIDKAATNSHRGGKYDKEATKRVGCFRFCSPHSNLLHVLALIFFFLFSLLLLFFHPHSPYPSLGPLP